jgi:hypothetical protein
MEKTREGDPKLSTLRTFLETGAFLFGDRAVTANDMVVIANERGRRLDPEDEDESVFEQKEDARTALLEALMSIAGERISTRSLGKWLAANEGRLVDGLKLKKVNVVHKIVRWQVIAQRAGDASSG